MFAHVLTDETLGLKGVPVQARAVAMLTQQSTALHPNALAVARQLCTGYSRVVIAALRADEPVLETLELLPSA
jgi:hypothetical protein